jgi:type II secretory pathway pseudopilin PulG
MAEAQAAVEEESVEVTLEDDKKTVNADEGRVEVQTEEPAETSEASEDELDSYSKGVQKRIKKLTEKYRYAERDKEEAARLADVLKKENEQLKTKLSNLDQGYLSEYGTRLESQLEQAKRAYTDAHERGDADALFNSQQALSQIAIEQERYRLAKQRQEQQAQPVEAPQEAQPQSQQAQPDPRAQKWAETNEWFGDDEIMTQAAFVIHNNLVNEEGFDPSSDDYYNELDSRLKSRFPNELGAKQNGGSTRVASASTSASRSNKQGRRTVKLSPSQIAMAKKLGVPLEEYAKYVKD